MKKKLIYTPIAKVLLTVVFIVSICTFVYTMIFSSVISDYDYSYKTLNEVHEEIFDDNASYYAGALVNAYLDESQNYHSLINEIDKTDEHNFRYILTKDGKDLSQTFDNQVTIFDEKYDFNVIKVTYLSEDGTTFFDKYYRTSSSDPDSYDSVYLVNSYDLVENYSDLDIVSEENKVTGNSGLFLYLPDYITNTQSNEDTASYIGDIDFTIIENTEVWDTDETEIAQTITSYTPYAQVVEKYSVSTFYIANRNVIDNIAIELAISTVNYNISSYFEIILLLSILLNGFCGVSLLFVWGKKNGTDAIYIGTLERIPLDLFVAGAFSIASIPYAIYSLSNNSSGFLSPRTSSFILEASFVILLSLAGFLSVRTTIIRIKAKTLIKNTLIWRFLCFVFQPFKKPYIFIVKQLEEASIVSKVLFWAIVYTGISTLVSIVISPFLFNIMEKAILVPILVAFAVMLKKLQNSGEILSKGDINYTIDTKYLFGDFKKHAENLNEIKYGLQEAVSEQMKSERLKTELITNVSHDIKTPLTSIINYVDLISKEETSNEKIKEYSEVLSKNSYRLKKLIEDLVSASKASTGNIDLALEDLDLSMLLTQTIGEYSERLEENQLEIIATNTTEPTIISADGKLMWRVLDNLLGNICKYSQPSTRVYLDVENINEKVFVSIKNISKYSLNMQSSELLERFVRGDSSRHTEGSGLGLSIAKNLVILQNGTLDLFIDGDLFKVVMTFDKK